MTENEINKLIKECVKEYFENNSNILFEMAIERNNFMSKAESIIWTLSDHVLLVSYCTLYDRNNQDFSHWKNEIWGFCLPLTKFSIKKVSKGNQEQVKMKALQTSWFEECEIDTDIDSTWNIISKEKNINFKLTPELKNKYIEILNHLINIISKSDKEVLKSFINSI